MRRLRQASVSGRDRPKNGRLPLIFHDGKYSHLQGIAVLSEFEIENRDFRRLLPASAGWASLNKHTKGAFYEVFDPERARRLVSRLEFRHTPKHGSWLNIAENELSSLTRQCVVGRQFGDSETLRHETAAWSSDVNTQQKRVQWHMKIADARTKLTSVYPKIMT